MLTLTVYDSARMNKLVPSFHLRKLGRREYCEASNRRNYGRKYKEP